MIRIVPVLLVLFCSTSGQLASAQQVPEDKVVRAVYKDGSTILYLPKGLEHKLEKSEYLKVLPELDKQKDGGYLIKNRVPHFEPGSGDKVVLMLAGTKNKWIFIQVPRGYFMSNDPPEGKKPDK